MVKPLDYPTLRATYQTDGHCARELFRQLEQAQRDLRILDGINAMLKVEVEALRLIASCADTSPQ